MKILSSLFYSALASLVLFASGTGSAQAQTPAQASTIQNDLTNAPAGSFFFSAGQYFSSSNTNLPFRGTMEISMGMAYQAGVNIAADFGIRYKFGSSVSGTNAGSGFFAESVTRNAGVGGIIVSEQVGGGYYYVPESTPDIEMSGGILGGYRFDTESGAATIYADIRKSLTPNTFAGMRLAYEWDAQHVSAQAAPVISAETGFTF